MIIQYASDLHLEFDLNKAFIGKYPLQPKGEVLILAGDITPFPVVSQCVDFFNYISSDFPVVLWIPGNHEYYYYDISQKPRTFQEDIRNNIQLTNNTTVYYKNVRIILSTLWSKISPEKEKWIERSVNDFHIIGDNGSRFSVKRFNELHQECLQFLTDKLNVPYNGKTIVVTHHVPTMHNYPPNYADSNINESFAVELEELMLKTQPDYWIYGHHHYNVPDFQIGKTRLLTNQVGYVMNNEQISFDPGKFIEI